MISWIFFMVSTLSMTINRGLPVNLPTAATSQKEIRDNVSLTVMQDGLHVGVLASAGVLATWSGTSMVVALAGRALVPRLGAAPLLAVGLMLAGAGEAGLSGLGSGSSWSRLVPGLVVAGVGSGLANSALGRLAVDFQRGRFEEEDVAAVFQGGHVGIERFPLADQAFMTDVEQRIRCQ